MTHMVPVVSSHMLDGFADFAAGIGLDAKQLYASAGLPLTIREEQEAVPLNDVANLLDAAARHANPKRPCLGIEFARDFPVGGIGALGFLLVNAPTIRAALMCTARYVSMIVAPIEMEYSEGDGGVGCVTWSYPPSFSAPRQQFISFAAAGILARLRLFTGETWAPLGVEFEFRQLECPDIVLANFGSRVSYNCPVNKVYFDPTTLATANPHANPRLFRVLTCIASDKLSLKLEPNDIVSRTQRQIQRQLGNARVDLDSIATTLGITARVLQRQLKQADTTFEALLRESRHGMGEHLVKDTDLPLTEIAHALGFGELSSFTRAFKADFKMSPRDYRQSFRDSGLAGVRLPDDEADYDASG